MEYTMRKIEDQVFLTVRQLMQKTSLSRPTISRLRRLDENFPRARKLGPRRIGFLVTEIDNWIATRP
ncbi:helix-turn-helix transcriptional regulator [Agrobacterium sp. NPDC090273]|uniref:helix-turn-helix transcriptional regulator n=1 Tax=Agrobacterium sp. NPDC090273 TaxID=3363919 RepID=UPI00383BD601